MDRFSCIEDEMLVRRIDEIEEEKDDIIAELKRRGWFYVKKKTENTTIFFENDTVIVTENADGELYLIKSKYIQDILDDWNGNCEFVPSNDARVFFASWNGKPISPYEYTDFGSLIQYLTHLQME